MSTPFWTNRVHTLEICEGGFNPLYPDISSVIATTGEFWGPVTHQFTVSIDPMFYPPGADTEYEELIELGLLSYSCHGLAFVDVTVENSRFADVSPQVITDWVSGGAYTAEIVSASHLRLRQANSELFGGFSGVGSVAVALGDTLLVFDIVLCE
jgi:hypothetical protein